MADSVSLTSQKLIIPFRLWCLLAVLCTALTFFPSLSNGFVNWDDEAYVINNELIHQLSFSQLVKCFSTVEVVGNYHPLTVISLAIDYALGGGEAGAFHITNLLLHLINVVLLGFFIRSLTGKESVAVVVMFLFGIHPMHVESVAWISARKDLLYTFFLLIGLMLYLKYVRTQQQNRISLWLVGAFFVLSLLSKSMAVVFPFLVLLIDFWEKRGSIKQVLIEKIPFLLISFVFIALTFYSQQSGEGFSYLPERHPLNTPFIMSYSLLFYTVKCFLPIQLSAFHPYAGDLTGGLVWYYYMSLGIVLLGLWLIWKYRNRFPVQLWGSLFFLLSLLPVLQLVPIGQVVAAERYTYFAYIGVFLIVGYGVDGLLNRRKRLPNWQYAAFLSCIILCISLLSYQSFQRSQVWKDGERLWSDVIKTYPDNFFAYACRGSFYIKNGQSRLGIRDLETSIFHNPSFPEAYVNRGVLMMNKGQYQAALQDFDQAIRLDKTYFLPYLNRSLIKQKGGEWSEAIADLDQVIRLNPSYGQAYFLRSQCYFNLKQLAEAQRDAVLAQQYGFQPDDAYLRQLGLTE